MIDTKFLQSKLFVFNNILEECNNDSLNLYKIIDDLSFGWKDSIFNQFYIDVEDDKKKIMLMYSELNDLYQVYEYVYTNYSKITNKIVFELKKIDELMGLFDNFVSKLEDIIKLYHSLNYSFNGNGFIVLNMHESIFKNIKNEILLLKKKNKEILLNLEDLEKKIFLKISKVSVEKIENKNLKKYLPYNSENATFFMDLKDMSINLRKLIMYKMNLDIKFENMREIINDINNQYITDNSGYLKELELLIERKMKIISLIYERYIMVIEENIERYVTAIRNVNNKLNNLK